MRFIIFIIISILFVGCKPDKQNKIIVEENNFAIDDKTNPIKKEISIDSNLIKNSEVSFLSISDGVLTDSIITICNCQKNKKDNTIFIQLRTSIPTKSQIQSGIKKNRSILQRLDYNDSVKGQFKFLTIKLKDSLVQNIEIYSKSTDEDYNGKDFESLEINNYDIKISTFDYSIASNVYGNFEMVLPKDFGYFKNDTLIRGDFKCNNWKISTKEEIQKWEINKKYPQPIE